MHTPPFSIPARFHGTYMRTNKMIYDTEVYERSGGKYECLENVKGCMKKRMCDERSGVDMKFCMIFLRKWGSPRRTTPLWYYSIDT